MSPPNALSRSTGAAPLALKAVSPSMLGALRSIVRQVLPMAGLRAGARAKAKAVDETTMHSPCL